MIAATYARKSNEQQGVADEAKSIAQCPRCQEAIS